MRPFAQLCSWPNLLAAGHAAARGKRGHANVAAFEYRLEENLLALQAELRSGHYRPGPYTSFFIHEPKRRLISAAPFRDRVVHHALCQIIGPAFERSFVTESFANRVGKGTASPTAVPEGRPKIAHRFNGGTWQWKRLKPRRGERNCR